MLATGGKTFIKKGIALLPLHYIIFSLISSFVSLRLQYTFRNSLAKIKCADPHSL